MKYLLYLLFFLTAPLMAQFDEPEGDDTWSEEPPPSGTFTGSETATTRTRDKGMGLGRGATTPVAEDARLLRARQEAEQRVESGDQMPPEEMSGFEDALGMGYYYLDAGRDDLSGEYLAVAEAKLEYGDLDAVLSVFYLYNLLADGAKERGMEQEAEAMFEKAESVADTYLANDPPPADAAEMHAELGWNYYDLGWYDLAAYHFHEILDWQPEDAGNAYMVASTLALAGRTEMALDYLAEALELGLLDEYSVDPGQDGDLDGLRDTDAYRELAEAYDF
ncbi:hypothetical protein [Neolewinella litorea]|uniref:Tetratricopeptide repeat protein n=1 Tax=Neolewinella litorea TaxID=2562452 RepID=A0A4S4NU62_9BACT|nr:hypothetical protein [Neolewinella litorea]THH39780.1 hypothetical protein E4021_09200 [Neolewinella litorea]